MLPIIQNRVYTYIFSAILVGLSLVALFAWGLKPGIDFVGGTTMQIAPSEGVQIDASALEEDLADIQLPGLSIQTLSSGNTLIQFGATEENHSSAVLDAVQKQDAGAEIADTRTIGGVISGEMRSRSIQAVAIAVIAIALYIAYAFRKIKKPISSWCFGGVALVALAHDLVITLGIFATLGYFFGVEIEISFIAALLTVLGYSINDTIVVFDRIRENIFRYGHKEDFEVVVNRSINETMGRSLNTSMTVVLVLLALLLFGGTSIFYFSLALLVGILAGTYSSIFVASALLVTIEKRLHH